MKKTILYSTLFFAAVSVSSCKKFLDKQPITEQGPAFVFNNSETVYHAIAGVYAQLAGDQGYGKVLSLYFPVDNDETQGPTGSPDNARREISRYMLTAGNAEIQRPFDQCFRGIEYANVCIANIPKMDAYSGGSDAEKGKLRRMLGEALALRAQFYFEAIRNWGDLPEDFNPASIDAAKNPFPSRTDRDKLYDHIIADLKDAEDMIPWVGELASIGDTDNERLTKGAVKALRARIALFRGGYSLRQNGVMERNADYLTFYQIAKDECADIIASGKHNLTTDFKNLWKNKVGARIVADPDNELMFQVSSVGASAVADSKLGYYNGPTVNALGNKSVCILPTYFYSFDSTDLRRDVTCAAYTVASDGITKAGTSITGIVDGKYRRDWINSPAVGPSDLVQYFGLKWQLIRYSDVLLMFAEAENELNGPTAIAYDALNKVRRRGFGKPVNAPSDIDLVAGLSKSTFFDALIKERSFELGGEGHRKYDLIRWNLLAAKIQATRDALNFLQQRVGQYMDYPTSMYFKKDATGDDGSVWATSFYAKTPAPEDAPLNTTKVSWIGSSITSTILSRFAIGFKANKSELLPIPQVSRGTNPNMTQNPNY
jgi:starch-binding outer membrane protein, SusD/RagB family